MKPGGIARLAEAFLEPVSEAVRTRCAEMSKEPFLFERDSTYRR